MNNAEDQQSLALNRIATALEHQPEMESAAEYKPTLYDHVSLISENLAVDSGGALPTIGACVSNISESLKNSAEAARTKAARTQV